MKKGNTRQVAWWAVLTLLVGATLRENVMANPTMPVLGEEAAEALSGTVDSGTGVKHQAFGIDDDDSPSAFSRLMNRERNMCVGLGAMMQGLVISLDSGLTVGAYACHYPMAGVAKYFPGKATHTLTASSTNYVYLDGDQMLKHSSTAWPGTDHFKLATVTTDATNVTAVQDRRFQNFQNGVVNNWWTIPPTGDVDFNAKDIKNLGFLSFKDFTELTIASGEITPTQTCHTVDTEAEAESDYLIKITAVAGAAWRRIVMLTSENNSRVVTIPTENTNIRLLNGEYVLNNPDAYDKFICLIQDSDTTWTELFRNVTTLSKLQCNLDADMKNFTNLGLLNFKQGTELTISGGTIARTRSYHAVLPESPGASDDLDTITGGVEGDLLILRAAGTPSSYEFTAKHNTGNILLANDRDYRLYKNSQLLVLMYVGGLWTEIARTEISVADLIDTAEAIPHPHTAYLSGALTVKVYEIEIYCHHAFKIKNVYGRSNTAPSGGPCIIDVRDDGNSIFANQADMVNIADGQNGDLSATVNHEVAAGSILTFEVEAANSAADATVSINGFIAPKTPP